jgi:hypothetical protein
MRRLRALAFIALLASLAMSADASPTTIGVFFDAMATDCDASVAPFETFNVYVSAVLGTDAGASGITGADFRVDGLAGLVSSFTPNPAALASFGDPTFCGCTIAFPICMTGSEPRRAVLLYTLTCSVGQVVSPRTVTVSYNRRCGFGDPPFDPYVTLCDAQFTNLLVPGGQALLNNGSCTVGLQPITWSRVKSLFAANSAFHAPVAGVGRR